MADNSRLWFKRIAISIGILFAIGMGVNWLMTYKLKDTLHKRLRSEIINATDSLYDFSFESLNIGLFSGELMIHGLSLFPDSTTLKKKKPNEDLPNYYFNVEIDSIFFKGINLTWKFYYRELSFSEFRLKEPTFKIISPEPRKVSKLTDSVAHENLYSLVSPFFDVIQSKSINFEEASIEYILIDSTISQYKLKDFEFNAYNFILDKHSQKRGKLLYSDHFDFSTQAPQTVFESELFLFDLSQIQLNTIDSTIYIGGVDLKTKEKYWEQRFDRPGSYTHLSVDGVKVDGIEFSRKEGYSFLDCGQFSIQQPEIEFYNVANNEAHQTKHIKAADIASWSLYSLTSPILERLSVEKINIADAKLKYGITQDGQCDLYTLNNLNFDALGFIVDSINSQYNMIKYVQDFSLEASDVQVQLIKGNNTITIEDFKLSTLDKKLSISKVNFSPIIRQYGKNRISGSLEAIDVEGIQYFEGLDADKIRITRPNISFSKGYQNTSVIQINHNRDMINNFMDDITPFINYVTVKDIIIEDGKAAYIEEKENKKYSLNHLNFYAKNFHIDKETRRLRDYLFSWDEYDVKFSDFDNISPDRKHRIEIERGEFNSKSKDILLKNLRITPLRTDESYIKISSPYIRLLGWDDKDLKKKQLSFNSLIWERPVIEIVKDEEEKTNHKKGFVDLQHIHFDHLDISSPSFYFHDRSDSNLVQANIVQLQLDSLKWNLGNIFSINNLFVDRPQISITGKMKATDSNNDIITISSFGDILLNKINISKSDINISTEDVQIKFTADDYNLISFFWSGKDNSTLKIRDFDFRNPTLSYIEKEDSSKTSTPIGEKNIKNLIKRYANETELGKINISNLNFSHNKELNGKLNTKHRLTNTDLLIEGLYSNLNQNKIEVSEFAFKTYDIDFPIADSFYTFTIDQIDFSKKRGLLNIDNIRLHPNYPKFDFAYIHPKGADWFNVAIEKIQLSGVNADKLISDSLLLVKKLYANNILLENLKNQKIDIEHNKMPLLYEQFQKFPIKYLIEDLDIKDFTVIYEELAKNSYQTARIPFSGMEGRVKNFTNIQHNNNNFYTLDAKGYFMGKTPFTAQWTIPIDSANDKFYLSAEIKNMDMRDFNQLIYPMAPAYVKSGYINDFHFKTEASSTGATVDMTLVYDSLYIVILNNMFSDKENKLYTQIVNRWGIENNNIKDPIRTAHFSIVRDPYHSTFNYFWQILQPPLVESVGVTEEKKNIAQNLVAIYNRIKKFFGKGEKMDK